MYNLISERNGGIRGVSSTKESGFLLHFPSRLPGASYMSMHIVVFRFGIRSKTMLAIDEAELPNPKQHLSRESLFVPWIFTAGKDALEAHALWGIG